MSLAFVPTSTFLAPFPTVERTCSRNGRLHCERRLRSSSVQCAKRSRASVFMMAKFQQKDDAGKSVDEEASIDSLLPPVSLPTLRSLSNIGPPLVIEEEPTVADNGQLSGNNLVDMSRMGLSMSAQEEFKLLNFFKSVLEELRQIEWPPVSRVVKITVIILVSMIVASAGIYIVDGFFYSMAQLLFETST